MQFQSCVGCSHVNTSRSFFLLKSKRDVLWGLCSVTEWSCGCPTASVWQAYITFHCLFKSLPVRVITSAWDNTHFWNEEVLLTSIDVTTTSRRIVRWNCTLRGPQCQPFHPHIQRTIFNSYDCCFHYGITCTIEKLPNILVLTLNWSKSHSHVFFNRISPLLNHSLISPAD